MPDVLFHATTADGVAAALDAGLLTSPRRRLYLSEDVHFRLPREVASASR